MENDVLPGEEGEQIMVVNLRIKWNVSGIFLERDGSPLLHMYDFVKLLSTTLCKWAQQYIFISRVAK
jgi:hypothetical protein